LLLNDSTFGPHGATKTTRADGYRSARPVVTALLGRDLFLRLLTGVVTFRTSRLVPPQLELSVGSPEELREELGLGMDTEFLVNGREVVPHCAGAQVEVGRNFLHSFAPYEARENFPLSR